MPGRLKISIVSELWTDVRFVIKSQSSIQRRHGPLDVIMHIHFLQPCFLHFNNMHERNEPTLSPCFYETHHINIETLLTHRLILKSTRSPTRLVLLLVRLSRQSCCASWDADDIDREFFTLLVSWLTLSFLWEIMNLFILRFSHGLILLMFYVTLLVFPELLFGYF